jgi:membrane protein
MTGMPDTGGSASPVAVAKAAMAGFDAHSGVLVAGGLAFFGALSLAPLLVVALSLLENVLGKAAAAGQVATRLTPIIGAQGAAAIQAVVAKSIVPGQSATAAAIAFIIALFGAGGLFLQVRASLDVVFGKPRPTGWRGMLGEIIDAAAAMFGIGLAVLIVSGGQSIISVLAPAGSEFANGIVQSLFTAAILFGLVALAYRYLVQGRVPWTAASVGSLVCGVIAIVATVGMTAYLGLGFATSAYGAAASFFVLLLWLWFLGIAFVVGAEFARAFEELRLGVVRVD